MHESHYVNDRSSWGDLNSVVMVQTAARNADSRRRVASDQFRLNGTGSIEGLARLHINSTSVGRGFMGRASEVLSQLHVGVMNE